MSNKRDTEEDKENYTGEPKGSPVPKYILLGMGLLVIGISAIFILMSTGSDPPDKRDAPFKLMTDRGVYYLVEYQIRADGILVGREYIDSLQDGSLIITGKGFDILWRLPENQMPQQPIGNPGTQTGVVE